MYADVLDAVELNKDINKMSYRVAQNLFQGPD